MQRNDLVSISEGSALVGKTYSSLSVKNSIHPNKAPRDTTEVPNSDISEVK